MDYKFLTPEEIQEACRRYLEASTKIKDQVQMFEIFANPDTNEGRFGPLAQGFVLARVDQDMTPCDVKYEDFVSDFCFHAYGNKVTYGMGNYAVMSWRFDAKSEELKEWNVDRFLRDPDPKEGFRPFTRHVLLGVIEPLNIYETIWGKLDFYARLGWRR